MEIYRNILFPIFKKWPKILSEYQTQIMFSDEAFLSICILQTQIVGYSDENINFSFPKTSGKMLMIQVNLCQNLSFLNQLTHNMTRDCSLNSPKNTSLDHVVYKKSFFVFVLTFKTIFFWEFNEQSLVILWVNWFKYKSFWKRFTCTVESRILAHLV